MVINALSIENTDLNAEENFYLQKGLANVIFVYVQLKHYQYILLQITLLWHLNSKDQNES